jgi:hypothetical protein
MKKPQHLCALIAASFAVGALTQPSLADEGGRANALALGSHSLCGTYEFHADGVVEVDGVPTRGFWEAGRFDSDCRGNLTNGVEYSSLLTSSAEKVIDQNFTFSGTYIVRDDGTAKASVKVVIAPGVVIEKSLWFILYGIGKDGIANGFAGGHADADLGNGVHGNTRTHVGSRIVASR